MKVLSKIKCKFETEDQTNGNGACPVCNNKAYLSAER